MPETTFHTTFSTSQFWLSRAENGSESGLRSAVSYRFGFNGKENDNEVKGTGNSVDFGARIYDSRLGRFLSVDPMTKKMPSLSPFVFAGNEPVNSVDKDGLFQLDPKTLAKLKEDYPNTYKYLTQTNLSSGSIKDIVSSDKVKQIMISHTMYENHENLTESDREWWGMDRFKLTPEKIEKDFTYGSGPYLVFNSAPGGADWANTGGYNEGDDGIDNERGKPIQINIGLLDAIEKATTDETRTCMMINFVSEVLHEYMEDFSVDDISIETESGTKTFGINPMIMELYNNHMPGYRQLYTNANAVRQGDCVDDSLIPEMSQDNTQKEE